MIKHRIYEEIGILEIKNERYLDPCMCQPVQFFSMKLTIDYITGMNSKLDVAS